MDTSAEDRSTYVKKISSAVFYGLASLIITFVNKIVLTVYKFPSYQVLGLGQMISTIAVLFVLKATKTLDFPPLRSDTFRQMWPLPVMYLGNMVTGLGGTKELSLPMFTALRRFSIFMTMIIEKYLLGIEANALIKISVFTMVGGAFIAAIEDITFTATGYAFVLLNDIFTSCNGVFLKNKLNSNQNLGKYGIMYYNCLFMLVPALIIAWFTGDIINSYSYPGWNDPMFVVQFSIACVSGFVLTYYITLCTMYNGALTTAVVGCLKNISVTYLGMILGGDYAFTWVNFIGLNISVLGSVLYTYNMLNNMKSACTPLKVTKTNIV